MVTPKGNSQHYQELRDLLARFSEKHHLDSEQLIALLKEILELLQEGDAKQ